jgi:hypothetical protein
VCWIPEPLIDRMDDATKFSICAALRWDE